MTTRSPSSSSRSKRHTAPHAIHLGMTQIESSSPSSSPATTATSATTTTAPGNNNNVAAGGGASLPQERTAHQSFKGRGLWKRMEEAPYVLVAGGNGSSSSGNLAGGSDANNGNSPDRPRADSTHATNTITPSSSSKQSPNSGSSFSYAAELFHAPLKWGAAATELVASTTEKMALTTMNVTIKTASALASTTEGVAAAVANKTANVAMNTAAITTQAFDLAASTTSNAVHATSDAVVGTATMVVGGLSSTTSTISSSAAGSGLATSSHRSRSSFHPIGSSVTLAPGNNGGSGSQFNSSGNNNNNNNTTTSSNATSSSGAPSAANSLNPPTSPLIHNGGGFGGKRASSSRRHQNAHSPETPGGAPTLGDVLVSPVPEAALLGRRTTAGSISSATASTHLTGESSIQKFGSKLLCLLGASTVAARKQWVANLTSSRATPPSAYYFKKIVVLAWDTRGGSVEEYFRFLAARPVMTDERCALKALTATMRLIREGPPETVLRTLMHAPLVDSIGAAWAMRVLYDDEANNLVTTNASPNSFSSSPGSPSHNLVALTSTTTTANNSNSVFNFNASDPRGTSTPSPKSPDLVMVERELGVEDGIRLEEGGVREEDGDSVRKHRGGGQHLQQEEDEKNERAESALHTQLLIARLAALIVQKLHFHAAHPQYDARYYTQVSESAKTVAAANMPPPSDVVHGEEEAVRTASALLTMLGTVEGVARLSLGLTGGARGEQEPEKARCSPAALACAALLIEEAIGAFDALTAVMIPMYEGPTTSNKGKGGGHHHNEQFKALRRTLAARYQEAYEAMRVYFEAAMRHGYIQALERVPLLSATSPLNERLRMGPERARDSGNASVLRKSYSRGSIIDALEAEQALERELLLGEEGKEGRREMFSLDEDEHDGCMSGWSDMAEDFGGDVRAGENDERIGQNPGGVGEEEEDDDEEEEEEEQDEEKEEGELPTLGKARMLASGISAPPSVGGGAFSKPVKIAPPRGTTTKNPFDSGNSSVLLLAEAYRSLSHAISNPFTSGTTTAAPNNLYTLATTNNNNNVTGTARDQHNQQRSRRRAAQTRRALAQCVRSFEFAGVRLGPNDVVLTGQTIGRGAFSVVYRGKLASTGQDVAVKELQLEEWGTSPEMVLDFRAEVAVMKAVHHPNVLSLIGAQTTPSLRLVSEYCHRGNLFDLLHRDRLREPTQSRVLSWKLRVGMALDEARGMAFLHTAFPAPLVHRDLKSLNLLLSQSWVLKVSDFGLSRFRGKMDDRVGDAKDLALNAALQTSPTSPTSVKQVKDSNESKTGLEKEDKARQPQNNNDEGMGVCGTTQWMAPEVMSNREYDETADVFSFGINLWELATRRVPWEGVSKSEVRRRVPLGDRLDSGLAEEGCPAAMLELMVRCWDQDTTKRPTFPEIVEVLTTVREGL